MPLYDCDRVTVSVLVPVRNEALYLRKALDSILGGTYPQNRFEILVVDGCSVDRTKAIVTEYQQTYENVRLINNPDETIPFALNKGVAISKGDIVIWLCGHAEYSPNFVEKSVELLLTTKAASVGGLVLPKGVGFIGRVIAAALLSPLGHGNAPYRSEKKSSWVDSVMGGCWLKKDVLSIGGFDEKWTRNQDSKFNVALRNNIGPILCDSSLICHHYVRESFKELSKQYFQYGYWRFKTFMTYPRSLKVRQMAAPILLLVFFVSFLYGWKLFLIIATTYVVVLFVFAITNKNIDSITLKLVSPVAFVVIHLSWGAGFLVSLLGGGLRKLKNIAPF